MGTTNYGETKRDILRGDYGDQAEETSNNSGSDLLRGHNGPDLLSGGRSNDALLGEHKAMIVFREKPGPTLYPAGELYNTTKLMALTAFGFESTNTRMQCRPAYNHRSAPLRTLS